MLAGFAGVTGRCTPMGRASMSLDLQQVTTGRLTAERGQGVCIVVNRRGCGRRLEHLKLLRNVCVHAVFMLLLLCINNGDCSAEGLTMRHKLMQCWLQLTNGLAELLPGGMSAADALRIADTYVKVSATRAANIIYCVIYVQADIGIYGMRTTASEAGRTGNVSQVQPAISEGTLKCVQAFYIPWGPDLQRWAATHPEYTKQQLASLIALIADSQGLKRRDKAAALAAIDAELVE